MMQHDEVFLPDEACEFLKVSKPVLNQLRIRGLIRAECINPWSAKRLRYRYTKCELLRYLNTSAEMED